MRLNQLGVVPNIRLVFEDKPESGKKSNPVSRSASSTSERQRGAASTSSGGALNLGFKPGELEEEEDLVALVVDTNNSQFSVPDVQLSGQFEKSQHFEMSDVRS